MLRIVEGLDKLESLEYITLISNPLLESPIDVSTTELPNDCHLIISCCPKLLGLNTIFEGSVQDFKQYKDKESLHTALTDPLMNWLAHSSEQQWMRVQRMMAQYEDNESFEAALTDPLVVWLLQSSKQQWMRVQGMMAQYEEEESAPTASTDLSIFWHPLLVSRAESGAQEQMRVPGRTEDLLTLFEEKESVPAASTDPLMVSRAESSAQAQMRAPGKMEQLLAPFEKVLEEEYESKEEDSPSVLLKNVELPQQHVTVEGGRGDVEGCSVQFQGQGGGDREEEDGGLRLHPLPPGSDQGRDQTLGHYSQAKRQRR